MLFLLLLILDQALSKHPERLDISNKALIIYYINTVLLNRSTHTWQQLQLRDLLNTASWALNHSLLTSFYPPQSSGQEQAQRWLNKFTSKSHLQKVSFPINLNTNCTKCADVPTLRGYTLVTSLHLKTRWHNTRTPLSTTHAMYPAKQDAYNIQKRFCLKLSKYGHISILLFVFLSLHKTIKQVQTVIYYSQRQFGS